MLKNVLINCPKRGCRVIIIIPYTGIRSEPVSSNRIQRNTKEILFTSRIPLDQMEKKAAA